MLCLKIKPKKSWKKSWASHDAATLHRYQIPFQRFFMKATQLTGKHASNVLPPLGDHIPATEVTVPATITDVCSMRVLLVWVALFVLPLAAPACPSGWKASPSPADGASEPRCFLVPPERSTSLRGCVERCARHGGAPACLASQEETDFVTGEVPALHRAEADDQPNNCLYPLNNRRSRTTGPHRHTILTLTRPTTTASIYPSRILCPPRDAESDAPQS